jgi:hypothetical protein
MTSDSVKGYKIGLRKRHPQVIVLGGLSGSFFLRIHFYLLIGSEVFIRISCDQPGQTCKQNGGDPFYDCAHVVLHYVRVRLPMAAAVHNLNVLSG